MKLKRARISLEEHMNTVSLNLLRKKVRVAENSTHLPVLKKTLVSILKPFSNCRTADLGCVSGLLILIELFEDTVEIMGIARWKMYLAHIASERRKQTVREHAIGTAELASSFAAVFCMEEEAAYIGMLHDIGKCSKAFQKRLAGGPKVDHSTAGAYEAFRNYKMSAAFCIAGHHSGLPDGGHRGDLEGRTLLARINRAKKGALNDYGGWQDELGAFNATFSPTVAKNGVGQSFVIRMLYSCLVDADYLDTERFMSGNVPRRVPFEPEELDKKLTDCISPWFPAETELNKIRCTILQAVINAAQENEPGLFTLTVPTGGGKTIASLAFAIKHAKKHQLSRIIYVIPYTSIIEQTAEIFRSVLGVENVLEHHSNAEYSEDEDTLLYLKATENWDMPVIVTTSVQFFESFYNNRSSSARKLHNIAKSVIIFDEAQMLPVPYIRPCVKVMTELVSQFCATVVLCTATQPALHPIIKEFEPELAITELCSDEFYENPAFTRVMFKKDGVYTEETIAEKIKVHHQALCIVNSRKTAQKIYGLLDSEGSYHLSTFMYPEHRKTVFREIRKRLQENKPCRVVSTSLIEAGVDVDFPVVYRQLAGLDSILQAGGRCNREGKRKPEDSCVNIFELESGSPEFFSMQIAAGANVLKEYVRDLMCKEAIQKYFKELFYLKGSEALDQKDILRQLERDNFPFYTVAKEFSLLGKETRTLYVETPDNEKEIYALKNGFADRAAYRKLGQYSISLYEYQFQQLLNQNSIEKLDNGDCVLIDTSLYMPDTGLKLNMDIGNALFI